MLKWRLTAEAQADMLDIRNFARQSWGTAQSTKYIKEVREKLDMIAQNPRLGVDRSADLEEGIRSIPIGSHTIYYEFSSTVLIVLAILHQAMTPDKHLRQRIDERHAGDPQPK